MDMTTTLCTYGSPDEAIGRAMVAQLGRFYQLPSWNTAATESKLPDAAAAAEIYVRYDVECALGYDPDADHGDAGEWILRSG